MNEFIKPVIGVVLIFLGLLLTFMAAPMEYEKTWVPHVVFVLGFVATGIGLVPVLKAAWPMLENIGRLAVFFFVYLLFLIYITELGSAVEVGFSTYKYLTVPEGSDIPVTSVVVILLTLAGMYFLTFGQKKITQLNL